MARMNTMHKPGEKAPAAGTYYCCVCSFRDEESTCDMQEGQMFLACPKCLERKVPEWDMTWKSASHRPGSKDRRRPRVWPGALTRPA